MLAFVGGYHSFSLPGQGGSLYEAYPEKTGREAGIEP